MSGVEPSRWKLLKNVIHSAAEEVDLKWIRVVDQIGGVSVCDDPFFEKFLQTGSTTPCVTVLQLSYEYPCSAGMQGLYWLSKMTGRVFQSIRRREYSSVAMEREPYGVFFLAMEILVVNPMAIQETGEPGKDTRFEILIPKDHFHLESGKRQVPKPR